MSTRQSQSQFSIPQKRKSPTSSRTSTPEPLSTSHRRSFETQKLYTDSNGTPADQHSPRSASESSPPLPIASSNHTIPLVSTSASILTSTSIPSSTLSYPRTHPTHKSNLNPKSKPSPLQTPTNTLHPPSAPPTLLSTIPPPIPVPAPPFTSPILAQHNPARLGGGERFEIPFQRKRAAPPPRGKNLGLELEEALRVEVRRNPGLEQEGVGEMIREGEPRKEGEGEGEGETKGCGEGRVMKSDDDDNEKFKNAVRKEHRGKDWEEWGAEWTAAAAGEEDWEGIEGRNVVVEDVEEYTVLYDSDSQPHVRRKVNGGSSSDSSSSSGSSDNCRLEDRKADVQMIGVEIAGVNVEGQDAGRNLNMGC
ncbi:hypothetical protein ACMFMF_010993 [Clarireedia jacksonii]